MRKDAKEISNESELYEQIAALAGKENLTPKESKYLKILRDEAKAKGAIAVDKVALADKAIELESIENRTLKQEEEYQILKAECEAYDALYSFRQKVDGMDDDQLQALFENLDKKGDHNSRYNFGSLRKFGSCLK